MLSVLRQNGHPVYAPFACLVSLCYMPFYSESMWRSFAWQVKWTTSTSSSSPGGSTVVARKVDNFDVSVLKVWMRCCSAGYHTFTFFAYWLTGQVTTFTSSSPRCGFDVVLLSQHVFFSRLSQGAQLRSLRLQGVDGMLFGRLSIVFLRIGTLPLRWTASTSWPIRPRRNEPQKKPKKPKRPK